MTIYEAIEQCKELSKALERNLQSYEEPVMDFRQIADWLKELQIYRQKLTEIEEAVNCYENCETCQGFREYPTDKFIRDLTRILMEVNADDPN